MAIAQEASCFATDVETVVAVLSDFKYSEALAEESVADEIRCQLKDQSMQIEELKAAIETELQTVRQQFEEAEVALESTKSSERQAVCELESKVNTLVEAQLKLQSVQDARKKVEKESRDELVVSDALHEAKNRNISVNEGAFCTLLNGSWTSDKDKNEKLATIKEYLQDIGTEKTLVAAADGLITKPEVRGDFDKMTIDCITEELSEKLKQVEEKLSERAPADKQVRAELLGLQARTVVSRR
ncbi:unnamed protein product [Durusdinium trenchii]|uniref:Uncharacterized protein n=1 Tax=Durusdinium trenchii TaxID=1381693 RepID=A0ABP0RRS6_9DINO